MVDLLALLGTVINKKLPTVPQDLRVWLEG